jgi:hypothetical protein
MTVRRAELWFRDAQRDYVEKHQGCPWCGGAHRVFRQRRDQVQLYQCQACDFQASHDEAADRFAFIRGEESLPIPETMCEIG